MYSKLFKPRNLSSLLEDLCHEHFDLVYRYNYQ